MRAIGATRSAGECADAVARATSNDLWRTTGLCLSAAIMEERDAPGAFSRIRDAAAPFEADNSEIPVAQGARFKAYFKIARGRTNWQRTSEKEHLRTIRKGIDQFFLSQTQVPAIADPLTQLLVTSVMSSSELLSDVGELAGHFVVLSDLQRMLEQISRAPEYLDLELRARYLKSRILIESDHKAIAREMSETMLRAQQLGFSAVASEAAHYCGWIAARSGDSEQARIFQSNALAFADAQDSTATRSMAYASAAFVEELIGTPEKALELARTGAADLPASVDGFPTYVLARAQLKCGLPEEAIDAGKDVVRCVSTGELARGATLLLMAQATVKLGRLKTAISHLDEAVARLRIFGNTYLLSDALSLRRLLHQNAN
jgi:tetratricopeptide (TPR) repeat protein